MAWLKILQTEYMAGSRFITVIVRDWKIDYYTLLVPRKFVKGMQLKVKILKRQGCGVKIAFPKKTIKGLKVLWCHRLDVEDQLTIKGAIMIWLKCVTSPGSFSNERVVEFRDADGKKHLIFAPCDLVWFNHVYGDNWVRVEILDSKDSKVLVQLPRETIDCVRTVTVLEDQLIKDQRRQRN